MRNILEDLWYGNICPNSDCRKESQEVKALMTYVATHHKNLFVTLSDQQKETLKNFDDSYAELTDINEREIFVYAFRLGARIALDLMYTENK